MKAVLTTYILGGLSGCAVRAIFNGIASLTGAIIFESTNNKNKTSEA